MFDLFGILECRLATVTRSVRQAVITGTQRSLLIRRAHGKGRTYAMSEATADKTGQAVTVGRPVPTNDWSCRAVSCGYRESDKTTDGRTEFICR